MMATGIEGVMLVATSIWTPSSEQLGQTNDCMVYGRRQYFFLPPRPLQGFGFRFDSVIVIFYLDGNFGQPGVLVAENFHFFLLPLLLGFTTWGDSPRRRGWQRAGCCCTSLVAFATLAREGRRVLALRFLHITWFCQSGGIAELRRCLAWAYTGWRAICAAPVFFVHLKVACEGEAR